MWLRMSLGDAAEVQLWLRMSLSDAAEVQLVGCDRRGQRGPRAVADRLCCSLMLMDVISCHGIVNINMVQRICQGIVNIDMVQRI